MPSSLAHPPSGSDEMYSGAGLFQLTSTSRGMIATCTMNAAMTSSAASPTVTDRHAPADNTEMREVARFGRDGRPSVGSRYCAESARCQVGDEGTASRAEGI